LAALSMAQSPPCKAAIGLQVRYQISWATRNSKSMTTRE